MATGHARVARVPVEGLADGVHVLVAATRRPTTTVCVFFIRAAARIACATAWADSSAGMMPSSRVRAWNPSSASWSVTETYSKRPVSL